MKRTLVAFLVTSMLLTLPACAYSPDDVQQPEAISSSAPSAYAASNNMPSFSDVPDGAWYADAVRYCVENGLFSCFLMATPLIGCRALRDAPRESRTVGSDAFLGTFAAWQKYLRGPGAHSPRACGKKNFGAARRAAEKNESPPQSFRKHSPAKRIYWENR